MVCFSHTFIYSIFFGFCVLILFYIQAIPLLLDIIRQAADSPQAYQTLGVIYEHQNQKQRALDLYLLSSLLQIDRDPDRWRQLATMAVYATIHNLCYFSCLCLWKWVSLSCFSKVVFPFRF